jgi:hypothetical protein
VALAGTAASTGGDTLIEGSRDVDSLEETFRKFKEESERIGRAFAAGVIGSGEYDSLMLVMIGRFQADLIVGYGIGMSYDD